ncbi:MAG: group I intron-associated PD-(D/E)XK endonuclease, partial [Thermoleophilaceae bacterium]
MFVQSTSRVGAIAELEIATAAVRAGLTVLRPVAEQARYDLALEIGPRLFRVQCKSGALDQRAGVIKVGLQSTWYSPQGYVRTTYSTREIDLVGVYCAAVDRSYLLPAALVTDRRAIWLRLRPPRNHQRAAINSASRYEFAGAVAQL